MPSEGPAAIQSEPAQRVLVSRDDLARSTEWRRRNLQATPFEQTLTDHLMHRPPDAVVIDLSNGASMQQSDLWRLCKTLDLPSIVITDRDADMPLAPLLEGGAYMVMRGPGEAQIVAAAAAALIRRGRPRQAIDRHSVFHLDGATIDLAHRVVRRGREILSLSPTEFNLLSILVRAEGRVCTQRELLFKVWGAEHASASHYLRLYIRYLRKKIERDAARPRSLLTVRGVGYRLVRPDAPGEGPQL